MIYDNDAVVKAENHVKHFQFNHLSKRIGLIVPILVLISVLTLIADFLASNWQRQEQRQEVIHQLSALRANLEFELYTNIELMQGAAAYIALNPDLNQQEFSDYVSRLLPPDHNVINIGGAKDFVVNLIYPIEGNEKALGLDYRKNDQQRESVLQATRVNRTILAGPVELVQGGTGLIARFPVTTDHGTWGVLSLVLDYQGVLQNAGITEQDTLALSLQSHMTPDQTQSVYTNTLGSTLINPVSHTITLPYGSWLIQAMPIEGWVGFQFHLLFWVNAFIVAIIALYIANLHLLNQALQRKTLAALSSSEEKFRQFFSSHAVVMLILDEVGNIIDANAAAEHYYGYSAASMSEMKIDDFQHKGNAPSPLKSIYSDTHSSNHFELEQRLASGEVRHVEIFVTPVGNAQRLLFYALVLDITERLEYQKQWQLGQQVFSNCQEGIMVTDKNRQIISVNAAFTEITGYSEAEIIGQQPSVLKSNLQNSTDYETMYAALESNGAWRGEIWNKRKDGSIYPELMSLSIVKDSTQQITNYLAVFSDITALKQSEVKLARQAHFDSLTGLPNRLHFKDQLKHAITRTVNTNLSCALLYLDLDRFKVVNDSLGHAAGDELLQLVSERLSKRVRNSDLLARMGGDEFVLLIDSYTHCDAIENLATTLIQELSTPFYLAGDHEVHLGVSVGIAIFPEDADNAEDFLVRADAAMYKAKQFGGNNFKRFSKDILVEAHSKLTISAELNRAIAKNELELYFQPQIDSRTGAVIGAEALLRWNHPTKGFLAPGAFMALAEQTKAIRQLTNWVVYEVFKTAESWHSRGLDWLLAFNVSALNLTDFELVETMQKAANHYNVNTHKIEMEIVESALIENFHTASLVLSLLRAEGFSIAVDDFGTGYSSLAYLDKLPIDKLKIDREFVSQLQSQKRGGVVKSIIDLANNFQLRVIAEGVETAEQQFLLKQLGCNLNQGYYYSRPLPIAAFEAKYST